MTLTLPITYAEMSYLRDVVRKDKLERTRELCKIFVPKDTDVNIINQKTDEYWIQQKRNPPITKEACIMLLLERFEQIEDKCREELEKE